VEVSGGVGRIKGDYGRSRKTMTQRRMNDPPTTPRVKWVIRLSISSQRYLGNQLRGHLSAWCALVEGLSLQQIATGLASEWPPMTNDPAKGPLPEIMTTFRVGEIGVSLPPWKGRFYTSIGAAPPHDQRVH
jgi:hypothetical protein